MTAIRWNVQNIVEILKQRQLNEFDGNIAVSGARGNGKTQVKGNKVLLDVGKWKNVEDIKVGDKIISPQKDGSFTYEKVEEIHNRFEEEIYDIKEVTRNKKILYSCAGNHELPIIKKHSKRTSKDDSTSRKHWRKIGILSAKELSKRSCGDSHYSSFTTPLLEFKNHKDLDIEPYCLGVFLGDGSFLRELNITSDDFKILEEISKTYPLLNICKKSKTTAKTYRFSINGEFAKKLSLLNLRYKKSGSKFIPDGFLNTSKEFRFNLLAGLIDTDGFVSKDNQITICTKSLKLAKNMKDLVFSLGGYSLIRKIYKNCQSFKEKRLYYDVSVQFKNPKIIPLRIDRKKNRLRIRKINPTHIAIESKKRNHGCMVYGFSITGKSKWYVTNNYMVTHNSCIINKIFYKFKGFKPWKHQVYSREDVIKLLKYQQFGLCMDDEAINSGYKRDFQNKGQQEFIKILNAYRDNYNIFASAIPNFFSLDKDLRDLYFIHLHVIERGLAVVHMPMQGRLYSPDKWDAKYNAKIEDKWSKKMLKNPNFKPAYYKLTTFRGYLYFNDFAKKQKELYKLVKKTKRAEAFLTESEKTEVKSWLQKVYEAVIDFKFTSEGLLQACLLEKKKYSIIVTSLNHRLKDEGKKETLNYYLSKTYNNQLKSNPPPSQAVRQMVSYAR